MLSLTEVSKNQMLVDIQVSCANGLQLKDLATSVDEHVPKVYIYIYISFTICLGASNLL